MKYPEMLIIDDDPEDVMLIIDSLESAKIKINIQSVNEGESALDYLHQRGDYKHVKKPDLIFLDLNMPRVSGKDVLKDIKSSPTLKSIPVVVLTTSENPTEIEECYGNGANCYAVKPVDMEQFTRVIQELEQFWFSIVKVP